jgi:hypothetical protein
LQPPPQAKRPSLPPFAVGIEVHGFATFAFSLEGRGASGFGAVEQEAMRYSLGNDVGLDPVQFALSTSWAVGAKLAWRGDPVEVAGPLAEYLGVSEGDLELVLPEQYVVPELPVMIVGGDDDDEAEKTQFPDRYYGGEAELPVPEQDSSSSSDDEKTSSSKSPSPSPSRSVSPSPSPSPSPSSSASSFRDEEYTKRRRLQAANTVSVKVAGLTDGAAAGELLRLLLSEAGISAALGQFVAVDGEYIMAATKVNASMTPDDVMANR